MGKIWSERGDEYYEKIHNWCNTNFKLSVYTSP